MKFRGYIEFIPEGCCDACGETVHNHFSCPSCGDMYAGTSMFSSIGEYLYGREFIVFHCECGTHYKLYKKNDYESDNTDYLGWYYCEEI